MIPYSPTTIMSFITPNEVTTRYTLHFECEVERHPQENGDEAPPVRKLQGRAARAEAGSEDTWRMFLECTMRDAVTEAYKKATDHEVWPKEVPPVLDIVVQLQELDEPDQAQFDGTVSWSSVSTEEPFLKDAIRWRIGDRMCYYGIQGPGVTPDWWCYTHPQQHTSVPLEKTVTVEHLNRV